MCACVRGPWERGTRACCAGCTDWPELVLTERTEALEQRGVLRVSERFRVIALGVPTPRYLNAHAYPIGVWWGMLNEGCLPGCARMCAQVCRCLVSTLICSRMSVRLGLHSQRWVGIPATQWTRLFGLVYKHTRCGNYGATHTQTHPDTNTGTRALITHAHAHPHQSTHEGAQKHRRSRLRVSSLNSRLVKVC